MKSVIPLFMFGILFLMLGEFVDAQNVNTPYIPPVLSGRVQNIFPLFLSLTNLI